MDHQGLDLQELLPDAEGHILQADRVECRPHECLLVVVVAIEEELHE